MIDSLESKPFPPKNGDKYRDKEGKIFWFRNGTWLPYEVTDNEDQ